MKTSSLLRFLPVWLALLASCSGKRSNNRPSIDTLPVKKKVAILSKPVSSFQDTLIINKPSAVFYSPDSMQLEKLRQISDKGIFAANMHEFESQFKNGHMILRKEWPQVRIVEARKVRFLAFVKKNGQQVMIDLDKNGDPYGLFIFDTKKDPELTDMMNIDTKLYYYFK
jgi:hypothetical protein